MLLLFGNVGYAIGVLLGGIVLVYSEIVRSILDELQGE